LIFGLGLGAAAPATIYIDPPVALDATNTVMCIASKVIMALYFLTLSPPRRLEGGGLPHVALLP